MQVLTNLKVQQRRVESRMSRKFSIICFLLCFVWQASATCRFVGTIGWPYTCHLENVVATSSSDVIDLSGVHVSGMSNADVTDVIVNASSRMEEIPSIIFSTFVNLQAFEVFDNHLRRIEMTNCGPRMTNILISGNSIPVLQSGAFRGCSSLQFLRITDNSINIIEENAFDGLSNVDELWLKGNRFTSLPQNLFRPLIRLQTLALLNNPQLASVHGDAFQMMANIFNIDLNTNGLEVISAGTFANKAELTIVNLRGNRIRTIEAGAFVNVPLLWTLDISDNELAVINSNIFIGSPLRLIAFMLSHNAINAFDQNVFAMIPGISSLTLWANICTTRDFQFIQSLEVEVFPHMQVCFENFLQSS